MYVLEENDSKNNNRPTRIVSGATKNTTGHWRTHCAQFKIRAYNFIITPGYVNSICDCMICDILWDNFGPFMGFTEDLLRLKSNLKSTSLTFTELFIDLKLKGQKIMSCPDLMFLTEEEDEIAPLIGNFFFVKLNYIPIFHDLKNLVNYRILVIQFHIKDFFFCL